MKNIYAIIVLLTLTLSCQSFLFESNNHKAVRLFKADLNYIEKCISGKEKSPEKLGEAVLRVERITGIRSVAGGDVFGRRFYPVKVDLTRWKEWLKQNAGNIRWDKAQKKVFLPVEKKDNGVYFQI